MKPTTCLIVDDEPLAQELLVRYIASVENLRLVKTCSNAIEAINFLNKEVVDVMFLDIKMPEFNGLDLLRTLPNPPKVILTTAYSEHALESYELGVVDYLLKPISLPRFLKAIQKLHQPTGAATAPQPSEIAPVIIGTPPTEFTFFKADKKIIKVHFRDIQCLEGYGNYAKVHLTDKRTLVILDKLSDLEKTLPEKFIRVHKSYIISIEKITEIEGNTIHLDAREVPVSSSYKNELNEVLKKHGLKTIA